MIGERTRPLIYGGIGLVVVWLLVWSGYGFFGKGRITPDTLTAYLQSKNLAALSGQERAAALRELARQMNALNAEERQQARLEGEWRKWFEEMTDDEKAAFIEATLPSGVKQMLTSFEKLPEEKRRRAVEEAMANLKRARTELEKGGRIDHNTPEEELSPAVRERLVKVGLNSYYAESSAQTKAELAPVLEEMQRLMENGFSLRPMRGP